MESQDQNQLKLPSMKDLAKALTHNQIRELRAAIDMELHCDLLIKLPAEIRDMILQLLPLRQCFQARRVSRAWYDVLSECEAVHAALRWWFPDSHRFEPTPSMPEGLSSADVANAIAEQVNAFRTCKPFSSRHYWFDDFPKTTCGRYAAYADGCVAWVDRTSSRKIWLFKLQEGLKAGLVTSDRSSLDVVAISSAMVAAVGTSGKCHVWELATGQRFSFRIPSSRVNSLIVIGEVLAIAWDRKARDGWRNDQYIGEIVMWDLKSQSARSILIDPEPDDGSISLRFIRNKLSIDTRNSTIMITDQVFSEGLLQPFHINFRQISFGGEVLVQKKMQLPLLLQDWSVISCVDGHDLTFP